MQIGDLMSLVTPLLLSVEIHPDFAVYVVDVVAQIEVIFPIIIGTVGLILVTVILISPTTQITIIEEVPEDVVISEVVLEELVQSVMLVLVLVIWHVTVRKTDRGVTRYP